ncbi:hypothetical protein EDC04DRAFT_2611865 [Pisolithus marmoratus]|nr:hypothetical protein EDC04DRAFT_2611865 [Pisolithus marmoratus]
MYPLRVTLATRHMLPGEPHPNCEASEWLLGEIEAKSNRSLVNSEEMCGTPAGCHIQMPLLSLYLGSNTIWDRTENCSMFIESIFAIPDEEIEPKFHLRQDLDNPNPTSTIIQEDSVEEIESEPHLWSPWLLWLALNHARMFDCKPTMAYVTSCITESFKTDLFVIRSEDSSEKLVAGIPHIFLTFARSRQISMGRIEVKLGGQGRWSGWYYIHQASEGWRIQAQRQCLSTNTVLTSWTRRGGSLAGALQTGMDDGFLELDHRELRTFIFPCADSLTPHYTPVNSHRIIWNAICIFHIERYRSGDLDTVYQVTGRLLAVLGDDKLSRKAYANASLAFPMHARMTWRNSLFVIVTSYFDPFIDPVSSTSVARYSDIPHIFLTSCHLAVAQRPPYLFTISSSQVNSLLSPSIYPPTVGFAPCHDVCHVSPTFIITPMSGFVQEDLPRSQTSGSVLWIIICFLKVVWVKMPPAFCVRWPGQRVMKGWVQWRKASFPSHWRT